MDTLPSISQAPISGPITLPPLSSITQAPPSLPHYAAAPQNISCARCGRTDTPLWRRDEQGRSICNACGLASKPRPLQPRPSTGMSPGSPSQGLNGHPAPISEAPKGSCPGDGQCNGQGGRACCQGCPAYNNRHGRLPAPIESPAATSSAMAPASSEDKTKPDENGEQGGIQCENCGTRTTPLWRRDGEGRVACNACGLYWKLHGSDRPITLNKPTIKRRKRIAPLINGPAPRIQSDRDRPLEVPTMPPYDLSWAHTNGDHDNNRPRTVSPHPEGHFADSPAASQGRGSSRPPSDPMVELAEAASRLEPLPSTPPTGSHTVSLPVPHVHHAHHPHHHHVHHHHHHPQPQLAMPRIDSSEDMRVFRDALREDVARARAELDHLKATVARGEQVLDMLDAALAVKDASHLEALIENNSTGASVPLKRKRLETEVTDASG